jgi:predicted nucleic acid-binding protein
MPLNLASGSDCFVDANIFYYQAVDTPPFSDECTDFLDRTLNGDVRAFTSIHLLAEALHKVMLAEAAARFGLTRTNLIGWLKKNADCIAGLSEFVKAGQLFASMPLTVLPLDGPLLVETAGVCRQEKLLTNDAMSVALMRRHRLMHLVTNDDDFDAVSGLTVWKPR